MNVDQFMPDVQVEPCTVDTWIDLLERRRETFTGFATIEATQGFIQPTVSFHTSRGQDMIRLLGFRVIEEMSESVMAEDGRVHQLEELIDALNYLLSIPLLDPTLIQIENLATALHQSSESYFTCKPRVHGLRWFRKLGGYSYLTLKLTGKLGDSLRNRAWMQQTQDLYFSNSLGLVETIAGIAGELINCFESWDEFYTYYIAKDEVLKFRLRSNY